MLWTGKTKKETSIISILFVIEKNKKLIRANLFSSVPVNAILILCTSNIIINYLTRQIKTNLKQSMIKQLIR